MTTHRLVEHPSSLRAGAVRLVGIALLTLSLTGAGGASAARAEDGQIPLPDLPEAVASFGAAVAGDHLYVYGGHVGRTHQHSIQNLSHRFRRLDLRAPAAGWRELGDVQGLQGLPLVAHGDRVCRVGGLSARNAQGEDEDLHSLATVACYDPRSDAWRSLPDLPAPRSSHDAAVLGDHLYVAGGWWLRGAGQEGLWHDTLAILDLSRPEAGWREVPQPFTRRALAVAAAGDRIFVLGGLGEDGTSREVRVFDPTTDSWSVGPELPEMAGRMKGFGISAFGVGERVLASGADGRIHALAADGDAWREGIGQLTTPRFFHRLLPHRERLVLLGGASREGHLASLESIALADLDGGDARVASSDTASPAVPWPGFRGGNGGHAGDLDLPLRWSDTDNLAWRIELPGYGQSAPIVWDRQVFVTSVEGPTKEVAILSAFDLTSGEVRWRRRFEASQKIENSEMYSRGAPTPVVDGQGVYAFWESGDVIALDHDGETLWKRSLTEEHGDFLGNHGVASSPVLAGEALILQVTHEGPSYYLALSAKDGSTLWKTDRPAKVAWTTPVLVGDVLLSSAGGRIEALDPKTGEMLWFREGIEKNNVPSLTVHGELAVVASSEPGQTFAFDRPGRQEPKDELWRAEGLASGFGSPLIHGDCVLMANRTGALTCLDPVSGARTWTHRLPESQWASPIAAGDRAYFFTKKGRTAVLEPATDGPHEVTVNDLTVEGTVYGAAATDGAFLLRTGKELIRIGASASAEPEAVVASRGDDPSTNQERRSDER